MLIVRGHTRLSGRRLYRKRCSMNLSQLQQTTGADTYGHAAYNITPVPVPGAHLNAGAGTGGTPQPQLHRQPPSATVALGGLATTTWVRVVGVQAPACAAQPPSVPTASHLPRRRWQLHGQLRSQPGIRKPEAEGQGAQALSDSDSEWESRYTAMPPQARACASGR